MSEQEYELRCGNTSMFAKGQVVTVGKELFFVTEAAIYSVKMRKAKWYERLWMAVKTPFSVGPPHGQKAEVVVIVRLTLKDIVDLQLKHYREHPDLITETLPRPALRFPMRYEVRPMPAEFAAEQREEDLGL